MKSLALLGAVALITSSASAIFTGWSVESSIVGDRTIYKIYANFSNTGTAGSEGSAARVLNVLDFGKADTTPEGNQIVGGRLGAMGAVHNDNYIGDIDSDGDGYADVFGSVGIWVGDAAAMSTTQSLTDSFVTMQGIGNSWGTALVPSFTVPFGPLAYDIAPPGNVNAGWYDSTPGTPNLVGATLKVRLLQIARLTSNTSVFTANMTLGYAAFGQTTPLYGYGSFTIGVIDSDGDGVPDSSDNCPTIANPTQANNDGDSQGDVCDADDDNDGVLDAVDNCSLIANSDQLNTDGDSQGDVCDADDDNDGVIDTADNCSLIANPTQANNDGDSQGDVCDADDDNDGVLDTVDNCPTSANSNQLNTDGDSQGDVCDADDDSDGVLDTVDNCSLIANPTQANNDGDSQGDVCDADDDNDGVLDTVDNCSLIANPTQANNDGDSQGDVCDADDDNDGLIDTVDNCQFVANPSQTDCNANGIGDVCDTNVLDCNLDLIPDTCQGAIIYSSTSPNLGSPSGTEVRTFTFTQLNFSESAVQLTIDVSGDLNTVNEWIEVSLNGDLPRRFFEAGGNDCPATPDRAVIDLTREQFAALIGSTGSLTVSVSCPATVDPTECKGVGQTTIGISYVGISPTSGDCDGDRRLDVCAVAQGAVPDCNNNRVPDSCDIASGIAKDCNLNGIPDSCDIASTFAKDCNANGIPDSCDIASGISFDIDGNSKPDECQTTSLTSGGNIQGAINSASASELRIVTLGAGTYSGPISITGKAIIIRGAGAANTIIQGTGGASSSVLKIENNPAISLIEGVTIRGGLTGTLYPNSPPQNLVGGGIFMLNSAGSIRNCIIESNFAGYGGGAYVFGCTGTISNCIFRNNNVSADGGGIQLYGGAPKVMDTVVENNFANGRGAGMHVVQGTPELLRVNIRNNVSNNIVGGLSWYGLLSPSAFLKVTSCQVTSNSALVVQGGIGISSPSQANISILDSVVCGNVPQPNISGVWENLGGNTVCKCTGDIVVNGSIDGTDLAIMISQLQTSGGEPSADLDESGFVDGIDLATLLSGWGACPSNGSITSITPAFGPTSGGTAITITGIGFGNMTSVKFGGIAATNVVATPTTVTAVTPARAAGVVDVAVSGPSQYVVATSAFTYSSSVVPPWATLLELAPDPAVVTDANLRAAIVASGFAWRIRDNSSSIEMLLVPAGTFMMGCSPGDAECFGDESPAHQVTLTNAFYMGKTEVTQAQWQARMGSNPSSFQGQSDSPSRPVEQVSWDTIQNFNSATGLRLPTEAEWEYAYRAVTTTAFHSYAAQPNGFNDDTLLGNIAWYSSNSGGQNHAVGGKLANGLGLHDMAGNVWEWCQDWYGPYSSASVINPTGPTTGTYRLLRGGHWNDGSRSCRASLRAGGSSGWIDNRYGFRAARTP